MGYTLGIPGALTSSSVTSLVTVQIPYLLRIISPEVKLMNSVILSAPERKLLNSVVSAMVENGLNYIQEKSHLASDAGGGGWAYNLDPPLEKLVSFDGFQTVVTPMGILKHTYLVKQLIANEVRLFQNLCQLKVQPHNTFFEMSQLMSKTFNLMLSLY